MKTKTIKESDVVDKRGNIVISPGLKVKHKESQFEYTVDSVVQEPSGKITIVLGSPEKPRFDSKDSKKVLPDLKTPDKKIKSNVLYEVDPVDDIKTKFYAPDEDQPEDDEDLIAVDVKTFEKEYEVK